MGDGEFSLLAVGRQRRAKKFVDSLSIVDLRSFNGDGDGDDDNDVDAR
jgi:hypothetical protein